MRYKNMDDFKVIADRGKKKTADYVENEKNI